jgi:formylmethanofuran dehydrogenase subunit C
MNWHLRLRQPPALRVDLRGLLPTGLAALDAAGVARQRVWHGNETLALGDLFAIEPGPEGGGPGDEPQLRFEGDLSRMDSLGWGLEAGLIVVEGAVGDHLGTQMRGGEIRVLGDAGDLAGCEMSGGRLGIAGSVGDFAASPLPGSMDGMRGGVLQVQGHAGARFADRMRRGTAVVHGDVGDFFASRLVAGTVALGGHCGAHPAYGMRRGSLVFAGVAPEAVPLTFVPTRHDLRVFWALLARELSGHGGVFAGLAQREPVRHVGDLAVGGQGEWLVVGH